MISELPIVPPHDLNAERAILGAVFLSPTALEYAQDIVGERDFYDSSNRAVYAAMISLSDAGEDIDHITVSQALKDAGLLERMGGAAAVAELISAVPSAANVLTHCRIVREKAQRRELRRIAGDLWSKAYEEQAALPETIEDAERAILSLAQIGTSQDHQPLAQVVSRRMIHLDQLYKRQVAITGLPTGFKSIDMLTAGFHPGTLTIIAARPSMGKSALALSIAAHVALRERQSVHLFSLEMAKEELVDRLLSLVARVDLHAIRTGQLGSTHWAAMAEAAEVLSQSSLRIDDSGALSVSDIRRRARSVKAKNGTALLIVDYLQLIRGPRSAESRQQEIAEISRSLKSLAKELDVPVVALSQLSRSVEARKPPVPMLSDLRESGAIEQDADVVMFIYREEVYEPSTERKGIADILLSKHRNGPVGKRELVFLDRYATFCELGG